MIFCVVIAHEILAPSEFMRRLDTQKFIERLNSLDKSVTYRLPTEAEWEYACRSKKGRDTPFYFGDCLRTDQANYDGNYPLEGCKNGEHREKPIPVGSLKQPNDWGLHDMHGNVWEWCQDWYGEYPKNAVVDPEGSETRLNRVMRGGSWDDDARSCRSANRYRNTQNLRYWHIGFRLARSLP